MKESDNLNPNDIKSQCDQAINKLENDNETLNIVSKSVTAFSTDNEIKSVSFENLKQQLADYITVIDAIKSANAYDIAEFSTLKDLVGDEVLDGANIRSLLFLPESVYSLPGDTRPAMGISIWTQYVLDNFATVREAVDEMKKETSNSIIDLYYSWKVNDYKRLAESSQKLYDEWKSKSDKYDEIEGSTSILFSTTSSLREAITTALNSMSGRFQSGTYIPRTGFDWKKIMEVECLKLESWLKAKEELKLSESETEYLKQKGIVLTTMDIACIKRTEGTELVFLSKDKKALFYKGEIYPIYVPDNEISFQPIWKLDGKKEISAMEFDALEGILGFSLEEIPKEDIYTTSGHKVLSGELSSTDPNVKAAAGLSALLGLTQFTLSSLSKSEVTVIFQSSEGGNRGTICVGNSEDRATFQNWNYNIPMDTYRDSEPGIGKIWASDYAAGIYKIASGKDVPNPDGTYTITGTLDERHKDTNISGYLSYSTDGKLMYTPLTYSGDKAYIESVDGFMEFGRTQILDFSDKLSTPSFADEDSQKLLEELLKGENE